MENNFTYKELEIICDLLASAAVDEERKTGEPGEYRELLTKVVRYEYEMGMKERMV